MHYARCGSLAQPVKHGRFTTRLVLIFPSIILSPGSLVARTAVINIGVLSLWTRNSGKREMMRSSHLTRTTRARLVTAVYAGVACDGGSVRASSAAEGSSNT